MKSNLLIDQTGKRLLKFIRVYPLQTMGGGFLAFSFLTFLTAGLILPHRAHGQISQNLQNDLAGQIQHSFWLLHFAS